MAVMWSLGLALFIHPCHNLGTWSDVSWTAAVYLETFVLFLDQILLQTFSVGYVYSKI